MNLPTASAPLFSLPRSTAGQQSVDTGPWPGSAGRESTDTDFLDLYQQLRAHGGMLPLEQVRCLTYVSHPGFTLSEYVLRGDLLTISWRRLVWAPVFQFRGPLWSPCPRAVAVIQELRRVMTPIESLRWLVWRSAALNGESPLDLLQEQPGEVLSAARALRFYNCG